MNDMVYGQQHLTADDKSFVFTLRVAENETMYGICCYVSELVRSEDESSPRHELAINIGLTCRAYRMHCYCDGYRDWLTL